MKKQDYRKSLVTIALVVAGIFALAVGIRGGWALANTYFEMKEVRKAP